MQLSDNCYGVLGLACEPPWTVNSGIIAGSHTTLVVDTGANRQAARTIHGYASAVRPNNTIQVINTEKHLDHVNGNAYFSELGLPIFGHAGINRQPADLEATIADYNLCITNATRRLAEEGRVFYGETRIVNPDHPISAETSLDLGNLRVEVFFTPGHTQTNLSVWVPDDGVLFTGDCLVSDYIPNLEGGDVADWQDWRRSLEKIERLNPATVMPGHGRVLRGPEIGREIARIREIVEIAIQAGKAPTA